MNPSEHNNAIWHAVNIAVKNGYNPYHDSLNVSRPFEIGGNDEVCSTGVTFEFGRPGASTIKRTCTLHELMFDHHFLQCVFGKGWEVILMELATSTTLEDRVDILKQTMWPTVAQCGLVSSNVWIIFLDVALHAHPEIKKAKLYFVNDLGEDQQVRLPEKGFKIAGDAKSIPNNMWPLILEQEIRTKKYKDYTSTEQNPYSFIKVWESKESLLQSIGMANPLLVILAGIELPEFKNNTENIV